MQMWRGALAALLVVPLVGGAAGVVTAANHAAAPAKPEQKPAAEKAAKPAAERARRHVGMVKAVDAAAKTLTVEEKSGDATVAVTEKTAIKRGKDTVKLEDLKVGDPVTVAYVEQDGAAACRDTFLKNPKKYLGSAKG